MHNAIKNRLKECNFTINNILDNLNKYLHKNSSVFLYCSQIENLGTKESDFDIYVIGETKPNLNITKNNNRASSTILYINNVSLDVEFWDFDSFNALVKKVNIDNKDKVQLEELKILHRILISEIIYNKPLGEQLKSKINYSDILDILYNFYVIKTTASIDDAIKLYNSKLYISALITARQALQYAIASINVKNGFPNVKEKWFSKIFIDNKGFKNNYLERYLNLTIYSKIEPSNISNYVEETIILAQDIISNSIF